MAAHAAPRTYHFRRLNLPRTSRARGLLSWATFTLGTSFVIPTSAESAHWLEWSSPPECPSAADVERRVAAWLGGPFPTDAEIAVRTTLAWNGALWEVTVEISFGEPSGTRRVRVRDCQEAADFVAVAVALAVDPSLATTSSPGPPTAVESAAKRSAGKDAGPPTSKEQTSDRTGAKAGATPRRPSGARSARRPFRPYVSVAAEGVAGVLPEPAIGGDLGVGGDFGRLSLSLGAQWLPPTRTAPQRATAAIDFSLLSGRLGAAYLFFGPEARVGPALSIGAGSIRARQLGAGNERVVEPWVSLAPGVLGLAAIGAHVSAFAQLELEVPLTRPTFVLSDESVVHRVELGVGGALGLRFSFLDQ